MIRPVLIALFVLCLSSAALAEAPATARRSGVTDAPTPAASRSAVEARDTLAIEGDASERVDELLGQFAYTPTNFEVRFADAAPNAAYLPLTFPSPMPSGEAFRDAVTMYWYPVRDEQGEIADAPAAVVVHSLHPRMPFASLLSRGLASRGVHAFLVVLPGYEPRRDAMDDWSGVTAMMHAAQAVADVRRARDAVAAIDAVDAEQPIGIVGLSMGGFVASVTASLDNAFDPVVLALSGADAYLVLTEGQRDALWLRQRLERLGYSDRELRELVDPLDPQHLVHRLDPKRTWLVSARHDTVIPRASTDLLAKRIGVAGEHHVWLEANHYSAVLALPRVIELTATAMGLPPVPSPQRKDARDRPADDAEQAAGDTHERDASQAP